MGNVLPDQPSKSLSAESSNSFSSESVLEAFLLRFFFFLEGFCLVALPPFLPLLGVLEDPAPSSIPSTTSPGASSSVAAPLFLPRFEPDLTNLKSIGSSVIIRRSCVYCASMSCTEGFCGQGRTVAGVTHDDCERTRPQTGSVFWKQAKEGNPG